MTTAAGVKRTAEQVLGQDKIVSSDSHIMEPEDLWLKNLTPSLAAKFPKFPPRNAVGEKPGGYDPKARLDEMAVDGVSAEVLVRDLWASSVRPGRCRTAGSLLSDRQRLDDGVLQSRARPACSAFPMISMYNIPNAIKELERCKKNGMVGCMIWQVPPDNLPFTSDFYNPFWEAASELDMPVNLHILTGFNYSRFDRKGLDTYRMTVNQKLTDAANTLFDFVFGGPLARYPKLKFVYVENEVGWIPFYAHEWDKYFVRHSPKAPLPYMKKLPGEYIKDQVYATFFSDPAGGRMMDWFGEDNFMWSSDYPHAASTWPHSRQVIADELGHLPKNVIDKVVRQNVLDLYHIKVDGINN